MVEVRESFGSSSDAHPANGLDSGSTELKWKERSHSFEGAIEREWDLGRQSGEEHKRASMCSASGTGKRNRGPRIF